MIRLVTISLLLFCLVPDGITATRVTRLSNGMDVVLVENRSVPMIAANLVIRAGARDESWHTWGAAHFLEHLLFNGTRNRTQQQIYDAFDRIGAYHNAHTGSHFTGFMLLSEREKFAIGFPILVDMVFNSTLPVHKFEKERGIVMEEIARSASAGEDPDRIFSEMLFGTSPLSREVLGTTESIARLERDSVMAFYKRWYQPNNCLLYVTGDFGADTMATWLESQLKQYPPVEIPQRRSVVSPDYAALSRLGLIRRSAEIDRQHLYIALPAPRIGEADYPAMMVLSGILNKRLESALPPGSRGGSGFIADPDVSVLSIHVSSPKNGASVEQLLSVVDRELKKLTETAINPDEVISYARQYRSGLVFNSERLHFFGILYAQYWALAGWDEFASWETRVGNLRPTELKQVAQKWLQVPDRFTMAVEPFIEESAKESIEVSGGIYRRVSACGLVVQVRSDPSARVFAMHILARNRWQWDKQVGVGAVDLLHRSFSEMLLPDQPLGKRCDELSATVKTADDPSIPFDDYYTSPDFSFIRLEMLPEKWEAGIQLLADLKSTTPTDEQITAARERAKSSQTAQSRNPAATGASRLRQLVLPESPLTASVYGNPDSVSVVNLEYLRREYLRNENIIITVASPVDAETVANAITRIFHCKPGAGFFPPEKWVFRADTYVTKEIRARDTLKLGRPQGAVVMGKILPVIAPEERAALTVANAWLSDRMGLVLRESRGLAYSLGSSVAVYNSGSGSYWGLWEMSLSTRPENLTVAESGIREIIDELNGRKFNVADIEKLTSAIIGRMLMRDMSRIGQAYSMGTGEFYWGDPESRARMIESLKLVTPEDVEKVVQRYLYSDDLVTVIVE